MTANQGFQYNDLLARSQMVDPKSGIITGTIWPLAFQQLSNQIVTIQAVANNSFGTNFFTVATQPSLGTSDAGYVAFLTDYGHIVYWTGTAWVFLDGGGGFFQDCPVAPQGSGWQLCDGTVTSYLTVGATLTSTAFTTPNLTGGAYRKSGTYAGSIDPAVAPGALVSGSTATGTTSGESAGHTHTVAGTTNFETQQQIQLAYTINTGTNAFNAPQWQHTHTYSATSGAVSNDHTHDIPALGAGTLAATVDATGEPDHLIVPVYFRR